MELLYQIERWGRGLKIGRPATLSTSPAALAATSQVELTCKYQRGGGSSVGGKEIIAASSFHVCVCVCVPSVPEIKALVLHGGRKRGEGQFSSDWRRPRVRSL